MQYLRSALFNLVMWVSVLVYAPLALLTFPFPYARRYRFISRWARFHIWLLRTLCGLDYRVSGREHLPGGAAIVLAKHQSTWETLAFQSIFPAQTWVLKRELMWVPLFGWALALLKPIAIDRGAGRKAVEQVVSQGRERLDAGIWVTVFPEGTRVPPGTRRRWGIGGAMLAAETGYPVVPVAHNAGLYWPRRGFLKRPGTIEVVIGPVIESRGRTPDQIQKLAQEWVEGAMSSLERVGAADAPRRVSGRG
ncbi:1-acyl-sn-glycerol-3-phosphate acyltransferase [Sulfurifustis variabilis]|uniref:1-acyl-sn-glycerol-3-phosphate acyltransferase n=1 Tax=Sulfurifustis variabilis TaxID=1675686 RepID=A0A1C7AFL8_9GAMM|nr:lysophospholipid acyltransferase family protein [Sulfurifustis variabilis]BAU50148.1 1-acyl-sn-glycerol-3-phosphate acyltransferase [Sulfurifustis variabilis]